MNKNVIRVGVMAASVGLMLSTIAPANAAYQSNGSFGAVYLYDTNYALQTGSFSWGWTSEVVGSASATAADVVIACPSSSTGAYTFIATSANTSTPGSWNASAPLAFAAGTKNILQPNLSPAAQINGNALGVKTSGGVYNLGVACTSNSGVTVLASYYRTITVTATTGAWTAADPANDTTGAYLPTPSISVVTPSTSADSVANRISGDVWVGDVLRANTNAPAVFPSDYTITYQWKRNGNAISGATSQNYTVVDNDGYAKLTVDVIYSGVAKTSGETPMVKGGSAVLGGTVSLAAGVSAISNGYLELSIPAGAAASFTAPVIENNYSVTRGTLGNIQVNDSRWITTEGWNLQADVSNFVSGANTLAKSNFGIAPRVVTANTTATGITAGSATVAGSATYPTRFAEAATGADLGNTGVTVLNADLTLKAPRTTAAGTYTSTVTLTLASK